MNAVEKAIRNAFEKGDASQRAFREKVYRSAFMALERFIQGHPDLSSEDAQRRRENLKARITEIESEFVAAVVPEDEEEPEAAAPAGEPASPAPGGVSEPEGAPEAAGARAGAEEPAFEPQVEADDRARGAGETGSPPAHEREPQQQRVEELRRRRRLPPVLLGLLLLAGILAVAWWGIANDIDLPGLRLPGNQPALQSPAGESPRTTDGGIGITDGDAEWATVFAPSNATAIGVPAGATAEIMDGEDAPFVRITTPAADTAISFDIGPGALERLAGGAALLSVVARAVDGQETQFSVSCDFGALGDCARKRYLVGATRKEHLLAVDLADGAPRAAGTISIIPDISGSGRELDVFEIKASRARR